MIIEEIINQRYMGIKNEKGVYVTPAFPKLVYVLDDFNSLNGGEYDYLLRCFYHEAYPSANAPENRYLADVVRVVKDYEFDYYLNAGRRICLNDEWYEMEEGSLMVRRPGDRVSGYGAFGCFMLTLDFSGTKKEKLYDRNRTQTMQPLCHDELLEMLPVHFKPRRMEECVGMLRQIALMAPFGMSDSMETKLLAMEFLHTIAADAYHARVQQTMHSDRLARVCVYMQQHCHLPLTLTDLASYVNLEKSYLTRLFRKELGMTPMLYLSQVRMENACLLLAETNESIKEIAYRCGYQTPAYFHACFKKAFHETPGEYRLQCRNGKKRARLRVNSVLE